MISDGRILGFSSPLFWVAGGLEYLSSTHSHPSPRFPEMELVVSPINLPPPTVIQRGLED